MFKYYNMDKKFAQIDINKKNNLEDDMNLSEDQLRKMLKEFDYIYFSNADEDFYNAYGNLFNEKLENKKYLYKITWNDDKLVLEKIS